MSTKLTPLDRWADAGPRFNRRAADVIYKRMMAMDADEALVYGRMLVADSLRHDLIEHREAIGKAAHEAVAARARALRRHYSHAAVAKARRGEDSTSDIEALMLVEKAFHFTTEERREYASKEKRGPDGRFVESHTKVHTDEKTKPMHHKHAEQHGVPSAQHLSGKDLSHYQQAYAQVRDLIAPYRNTNVGALLHLNIERKNGTDREVALPITHSGADVRSNLHAGERIRSAAVSVAPSVNAPGAAFDTMAALGAPRAGGTVANAYEGVLNPQRLRQYHEAANGRLNENEPHSASTRAFRRLHHGSALLQDSLGDNAPRKVQYALAVANHVGQYGPEAQKVIGPAADRAAYRYRGTERTPSRALGNAFESIRRNPQLPTAADKREVAVSGIEGQDGWNPGPVLSYFHRHLPNASLNTLQRKSGNIPPSEGVIIDRNGKVVTQAVGHGDDWYLPFNLKHLSKLKGGEYIRTRTFGGPTTEDLYTGLVSGARSMTVVSHNGVYTVDFDENLRGGRRFNDKAARMVARYGHLLDAVKSEQVSTGGIAPSRMEELREKASRGLDPTEDETEIKERLDKLVAHEHKHPTMSKQQKGEAAVEWLNSIASKHQTRDGHPMNAEELTAQVIDSQAQGAFNEDRARAKLQGAKPVGSLEGHRRQAAERLYDEDPVAAARKVADALGMTRNFDRHMADAEKANSEGLTPLRLNGQGYRTALDALQEQFPYYIANVTFHPWSEAVGAGETPHVNASDTGYVKPRHNRPEQALSGYFDTDVTGHGKVRAHTTRFQNYPVHQGHPRPVGATKTTTKETKTATGNQPSAETAAELQHGADKAMLDELFDKTQFAPNAKMPQKDGTPVEVGGRSIAGDVKDANFPDNPIKRLYSQSKPELERKLDDPAQAAAVRDLMRQAVDFDRQHHVLGLSSEKTGNFLRGGRVEAPKPVPTSTGAMLREWDKPHEFSGSAFDSHRQHDTQSLEDAYQEDSRIKPLLESGKLPQLGAADFGAKASALRSELERENSKHLHSESVGARTDSEAKRKLHRQAEGLLRAKQLRANYDEAKRNAPSSTPAPAGHPDEVVSQENHLHLQPPARRADESPEEYAQTLREWQNLVGQMSRPGGPEPGASIGP